MKVAQRDWRVRLATEVDIPALEALIPHSARMLQTGCYSSAQIEAALGPVFGVDRQLIRDGTYFVVEAGGIVAGCGGWSKRESLYGGDGGRAEVCLELDPEVDAARVRAFFVHPNWARKGIGQTILKACEEAIKNAGFRRIEIVATLSGEPLYSAFGYSVSDRFEILMKDSLKLPVVRLEKAIAVANCG